MKIEIKDLKRGQLVYDSENSRHRVYAAPEFIDGRWQCETTSDDFAVLLVEGDDEVWDNGYLPGERNV